MVYPRIKCIQLKGIWDKDCYRELRDWVLFIRVFLKSINKIPYRWIGDWSGSNNSKNWLRGGCNSLWCTEIYLLSAWPPRIDWNNYKNYKPWPPENKWIRNLIVRFAVNRAIPISIQPWAMMMDVLCRGNAINYRLTLLFRINLRPAGDGDEDDGDDWEEGWERLRSSTSL